MKPIIQLLYLLAVCLGCLIIGNTLLYIVLKGFYGGDIFNQMASVTASSPQYLLNAYKISLALGTTISVFLAPALFFGYLVMHDAEYYLHTREPISLWQPLLAIVVMLAASPIMEFLVLINEQMTLPQALKGIENWMREEETVNDNLIKVVLQVDTPLHLTVSLLIGAVLPALGEEFIFRGCLQSVLERWTGSIHAAIWIAAFVFSAMHMQFFGFLPRFALGALFGYLVVWSDSIWPAVVAHFLNNGMAVVAAYLYEHKQIKTDLNADHVFNYSAYAFSLLIVLFLLWVYKSIASGKRMLPG